MCNCETSGQTCDLLPPNLYIDNVNVKLHGAYVPVGVMSTFGFAELVNARLAMIGIVWGGLQEFKTGETMLSQAQNMSLPAIIVCLLFVYASMVPVMHSARMEPFGIFTPRCASGLPCGCTGQHVRGCTSM